MEPGAANIRQSILPVSYIHRFLFVCLIVAVGFETGFFCIVLAILELALYTRLPRNCLPNQAGHKLRDPTCLCLLRAEIKALHHLAWPI